MLMQCFFTFWWSFFILWVLFRLIFRRALLLFEASVSQMSQVNPICGPKAVSQTVASLFKSKIFPKSKSRFWWCSESTSDGKMFLSMRISTVLPSIIGIVAILWLRWCCLWAKEDHIKHENILKIIILVTFLLKFIAKRFLMFLKKTSLWTAQA